ncbi:MAG TPA: rRNA maturation RNase YbeY [Actinomycetota bacterium]|nr:rRNA maturation RNase YbeY [Actinomycetota bacterium]
MDVFVANEQDIPVDHDRLSTLAAHTLQSEDVDDEAELSVLFVTPEHMRRLNSHFAGDDYATDVLSFPMLEGDPDDDDGPVLLGDVVVCPAVAERNAQKAGQPLTRELDMLVVHGTLHLLGYDHQGSQDRSEMERRQRDILASFERVDS